MLSLSKHENCSPSNSVNEVPQLDDSAFDFFRVATSKSCKSYNLLKITVQTFTAAPPVSP